MLCHHCIPQLGSSLYDKSTYNNFWKTLKHDDQKPKELILPSLTETEMLAFCRNFHHRLPWNDNFQCSQWWKFHQNNYILFYCLNIVSLFEYQAKRQQKYHRLLIFHPGLEIWLPLGTKELFVSVHVKAKRKWLEEIRWPCCIIQHQRYVVQVSISPGYIMLNAKVQIYVQEWSSFHDPSFFVYGYVWVSHKWWKRNL